jgi:hypothetical protein
MAERRHLINLVSDERMILKWIFKKSWTGLNWRASVTTVMNLHVLRSAGNFLLAEELSASQEGLCFLELDRMLIVNVAPMKGFANSHTIEVGKREGSRAIGRTRQRGRIIVRRGGVRAWVRFF